MGPLNSAAETLPLSVAAAARVGLGPLRHVAATGSTNDDLAGEARRGSTGPSVLVADHQTAGRGRLGRRWLDAGARPPAGEAPLLVSLRLPGPVAEASARVAAVSAAALAAATAALAGSDAVVLAKWPNDLLIEGPDVSGKLAGVLSEVVGGPEPVVVVGLGLNVAPAPDVPAAVSLAEAGSPVTRDEMLAGLLDALPGRLADPGAARAELSAASATVGRRVRVECTDGTSVSGEARRIDAGGRLVVVASGREHLIDAGDVFHLR